SAAALWQPGGEAGGIRAAALPQPAADRAGRAGWQAAEADEDRQGDAGPAGDLIIARAFRTQGAWLRPRPFFLFLTSTNPWPLCRKAFRTDRKALLVDRKALLVDRKALLVGRKASLLNRKALLVSRKASLVNRKALLVDRKAFLLNRKAFRLDRIAFLVDRKALPLDRMAFFLKRKALFPIRLRCLQGKIDAGAGGSTGRSKRSLECHYLSDISARMIDDGCPVILSASPASGKDLGGRTFPSPRSFGSPRLPAG